MQLDGLGERRELPSGVRTSLNFKAPRL